MHLQIIDAGEGLISRRYVANEPHCWARLRESRVAVGTELADGMLGGQLFGPGGYHSRIFGLMGGGMGRSEGATAEKAVPFLCAARRSLSSRSV
jgi:hypothetical protein